MVITLLKQSEIFPEFPFGAYRILNIKSCILLNFRWNEVVAKCKPKNHTNIINKTEGGKNNKNI